MSQLTELALTALHDYIQTKPVHGSAKSYILDSLKNCKHLIQIIEKDEPHHDHQRPNH